jgi:hypothetical protein
VFSQIFIAEEVGGVGDEGSGDTTRVHVQTLLEAALSISMMKLSSFRNQNLWSWDYSPQVPNYQDFQITGLGLKEFC